MLHSIGQSNCVHVVDQCCYSFFSIIIRIQTLGIACKQRPPCCQILFSSVCVPHALQCIGSCVEGTLMESRIEHHCLHFPADLVLVSRKQCFLLLLQSYFHLLDAVSTWDSAGKKWHIVNDHC